MRRCVLLCLVLGTLAGCHGRDSPTAPDGPMEFTTVAAATVAGSAGPQVQRVVRDSASWTRLWSDLWAGRPPAEPAVDFSRDMVVVVTASEICFGGVTIEEIELSRGVLEVRYADAAPSLCLCIQPELTFHAVSLPHAPGSAVFERRVVPPLCPS